MADQKFWAQLVQRQVAYDEALRASGYRDLGPLNKQVIVYSHSDCGQVVSGPYAHDQVCPKNDRGRTTPRLPESTKWGRPV
jgi:hypothetical protein